MCDCIRTSQLSWAGSVQMRSKSCSYGWRSRWLGCVACCERWRARAMSVMMAMSSIGVFGCMLPRWRSVVWTWTWDKSDWCGSSAGHVEWWNRLLENEGDFDVEVDACESTHVGWNREKIESSQHVMVLLIVMMMGTRWEGAWQAVTMVSDVELGQQENRNSNRCREILSPHDECWVGYRRPKKWSWKGWRWQLGC